MSLSIFTNVNEQVTIFDSGSTSHVTTTRGSRTISHPDRFITITGVSGVSQKVRVVHDTIFGDMLWVPSSPANLISPSRLRAQGWNIHYSLDADQFEIDKNSHKFIFKNINGLYKDITNHENVVCLSMDQQDRATKARALHERLGHPGLKAFCETLDGGTLMNNPVTSTDAKLAEIHLGPCSTCILGKMTRPPALTSTRARFSKIGARVHMDIFFLGGRMFLLSVDESTGFLATVCIGKRDTATLSIAITRIVNQYASHKHTVDLIAVDNEAGVPANLINSLGSELSRTAAQGHERRAERWIRTLKDVAHAIFQGAPYGIPDAATQQLVAHATALLNMRWNTLCSPGTTPSTLVTGRKPDLHRDVTAIFGKVYLWKTTYTNSSSVSEAKAFWGMAMSEGTVLDLRTLRLVRRTHHHAKEVHLTDEIIKRCQSIRSVVIFTDADEVELDIPLPEAPSNSDRDPTEILPQGETRDYNDGDTSVPQFPDDQTPPAGSEAATHPTPTTDIDAVVPPNIPDVDITQNEQPVAPPVVLTPHEAQVQNTIPEPTPFVPIPQPPLLDLPVAGRGGIRQLRPSPAPNRGYEGFASPVFMTDDGFTMVSRRRKKSSPIQAEPTALATILADTNTVAIPHEVILISVNAANKLDAIKTKTAIRAELTQMITRKVFKAIMRSEVGNETIIPSMMVMKPTPNAYKARLVAAGNHQDRSQYSETEVSGPTIQCRSILTICAVGASEGLEMCSGDVTGAYLWASLPPDGTVVMRLGKEVSTELIDLYPEFRKYLDHNGMILVRLYQALYGLVESAVLWNKEVTNTLLTLGYNQAKGDPCVFVRQVGKCRCIIGLYVDDFIVACNISGERQRLFEGLASKYGVIKQSSGKSFTYRGLEIETGVPGTPYRVHQTKYALDLIRDTNTVRFSNVPAGPKLFDIDLSSPLLSNVDAENFVRVNARILWLSSQTRIDLKLASSFLSSRVRAPTQEDLNKQSKLLAYIHGSIGLGLTYLPNTDLKLVCFADASYLTHPDCKGHTGLIYQLGGGTIGGESRKQSITAQSSTESELIALNTGKNNVLGLRTFLESIKIPQTELTVIYEDNQSVLALLDRGAPTLRTQHIGVRYFSTCDAVRNGSIVVKYLPTNMMCADQLTKPLSPEPFLTLRNKIMGETHEDLKSINEKQTLKGDYITYSAVVKRNGLKGVLRV